MKHETFTLDALTPYHQNARRGNVDAIAESLRENGQYKPIVVNVGTHTGRANEVLVGNHTMQAAQQLGWTEIAAVVVDATEDEARRIVLADNRTSDLGSYDDELLLDLLQQQDDLMGTAFTAEFVDDLLAHLAPPSLDELAEQYGEPVESDLFVAWTVKVPERTAKELQAALDRFDGEPHEQAARLAEYVAKAEL